MIYAAALLGDLGTRPIHTAPVTAPLLACALRTKPSVQNGNFYQPPADFFFFGGPIRSEAKLGKLHAM